MGPHLDAPHQEITVSTTSVPLEPAIRPLSRQECLDLLAAGAVGRIGFVTREGVEILPVGYRLGVGPRLFVSTQMWGTIGQLAELGARCSFEVDYHGSNLMIGWSVVMQGVLTRLDRAGAAAYTELGRSVDDWPGYADAKPVQFVPQAFSGRSVLRQP